MKILLYAAAALLLAAALAVGWLYAAYPRVAPAPALEVQATPALISEGEYLVETVMVCTTCHAERDITLYAQPIVPGTAGAGGYTWSPDIGFPGTMAAPNITPHRLGVWSDGEIARAITDGVSREGSALFPLMGYPHYRHLCEADLTRVVAYLRSLPHIASDHPPRRLDFPLNLLVRTFPQPSTRPSCPDAGDPVARGRYLAELGSCHSCHTPQRAGRAVEERAFAGGFEFPLHDGYGTSVSANITPHPTGIGAWTAEAFVARFRGYRDAAIAVSRGEPQTEMPWTAFAHMRDEDLLAIYAYLRTVEPLDHQVATFLAPAAALD